MAVKDSATIAEDAEDANGSQTNESQTGVVFNIQRYSVHDGPGIRTVVFLKGCPLRCKWCSNPESQSLHPDIMYNKAACARCGACVQACPTGCIHFTETGVLLDRDLCTKCGTCAAVCLFGGLRVVGRRMTVDDVIREVEKDRVFYDRSGGGLTLSGGEPTLQARFAAGLIEAARDRGLTVAIETCGHQDPETFLSLVERVDLVMYDLKIIDASLHRDATGVPNELILENVRLLAARDVPLTIRIPVIPGFTDSEANIAGIAKFVESLHAVREVELVPYHRFGQHKYEMLGREYLLSDAAGITEERLKQLSCILAAYGLNPVVGG